MSIFMKKTPFMSFAKTLFALAVVPPFMSRIYRSSKASLGFLSSVPSIPTASSLTVSSYTLL